MLAKRGVFSIGLLAAFVLIFGVMLFSLNTILPLKGLRFDFYPRWVGSRAFWNGQDPYSADVTSAIQQGMFGDALPPEADQQNFVYPAYTALFLAPIVALPAPQSVALWMAIQLAAIAVSIALWPAIVGWKPAPLTLFALLLGLLLVFHYPIDTFILGQFTGTILLSISLGVWLLLRGRDAYAGVVFSLATVPPTMGMPLALAILGIFALRGRSRGLAAFVITMTALIAITILRIGWWIPTWLRLLPQYALYANPVWPPGFFPFPLNLLFIGVVALPLLWSVRRYLLISPDNVDIIVAILLATLLLLPQTGYYYLVLLIPVIVACLYRALSLPVYPRYLVLLSCAAAVVSPWVYLSLPGYNLDMQSLVVPLHVALTWIAIKVIGRRQ